MALWLVTGGCGFIGSHLVEALARRGDRVRVLDDLSTGSPENLPPGTDLRIGDVADGGATAAAFAGVDGCFHLAAVSSVQRCTDDWVASHRTNLTGTITVFDQARRTSTPVVYASSAAVYGDNAQIPLAESAVARPLSAYGVDKLAGEMHGRVAWSVHGVPNIGLRFFNVFGPRQDPRSPYSGVIAIFAARIAAGCEIEIFGDGAQTRDFIYVADVVDHLLAAMRDLRRDARIFNVCTGRGCSVGELAMLIGEVAGREPRVRYGAPRAGDIKRSIGDPTSAIAAFGLRARTPMREGLAHTLAASG